MRFNIRNMNFWVTRFSHWSAFSNNRRPQLLTRTMMMMLTFLVRRLKRRRRLLKSVLRLPRLLARRKNVCQRAFFLFYSLITLSCHFTIKTSLLLLYCWGLFLTQKPFHTLLAGKSSVLLDVKPWDDETDMAKLEEAVRSVQMEGLFWGACMLPLSFHTQFCESHICFTIVLCFWCEHLLPFAAKLVPVGYGIKKLQIMMTIVDDLVSVDTLIEDHLCAEPISEYVQSCDIVAFNKICKSFSTWYLQLQ